MTVTVRNGTARKQYCCAACSKTIVKGVRYIYVSFLHTKEHPDTLRAQLCESCYWTPQRKLLRTKRHAALRKGRPSYQNPLKFKNREDRWVLTTIYKKLYSQKFANIADGVLTEKQKSTLENILLDGNFCSTQDIAHGMSGNCSFNTAPPREITI